MFKRLFDHSRSSSSEIQSRLDALERQSQKAEVVRQKVKTLEESLKKQQREFQRLMESSVNDRLEGIRKSVEASLSGNDSLPRETERLLLLCGRQAALHSRSLPASAPFADAEFRVFSQWGEDGILQFLLAHVPVEKETFVEFGVQDYSEANTRFLLMNNNWRGLILDGSKPWMSAVQSSELAWRYDLTAKDAWVTAENINDLIAGAGIKGDIGLLSVDVDGVDYWIWKAIDLISPRIVVCEYNSIFGPDAAVTPPYDPKFMREAAHPSMIFYGASIAAVEKLGRQKGYRLVGSNSSGNNAFLVREDVIGNLPVRSAREAWRESRFREARGEGGVLIYPTFEQARGIIADCVAYDVERDLEAPLRNCTGWENVRPAASK